MSDNTLPKQPAQTDDEAAGLLMLFSNESKRQTTTTTTATVATTIATGNIDKETIDVPIATIATALPSPVEQQQHVSKRSTGSSNSNSELRRSRGSSFHENKNPPSVDSMIRSPGPASAALASGVGSNKAIVAAAALAAAAATPIPIIHKPLKTNILDTSNPTIIKVEQPHIENLHFSTMTDSVTTEQENPALDETEPEEEDQVDVDMPTLIKDETVKSTGPPSYAVGPDAGIIGCVCGYDHDDGLTIQCDKCFRWQHLVCMGFESITDTPDDFLCNLCNDNLHVDVNKARKAQEAYLKEEKSKRRKSPYASEPEKEVKQNVGAAQFKKKKSDDSNVDISGVDKYQTLYYPINYFVYKSPTIKSLFNQLPDILKKDKLVLKYEKSTLSKNVLNSSNLNIKNANDNRSRFTGVSRLGLYTNKALRENVCVSLLSGEIDTKENYMLEKVNKYWLLGCPKPHVIVHPNLPLVIDQRGLGNCTRFIRKSCKPNAVVRTILVGKNDIALGVFTTKELKADQEILLEWEWDVNHPMVKIMKNEESFESLDHESKGTLINSIQSILDHTDCGCSSTSDCMINKVKKSTAYLQRNSRRNNNTIISPSPNQKYVPFEERSKDRNKVILSSMKKDVVIDDIVSIDVSNVNTDDNVLQDAGNFNFKFKPKMKNTLYNLHILPKQFELLKKYVNTDKSQKQDVEAPKESEMMPIPISVNSKVLQVLEVAKPDSSNTIISTANQSVGEIKNDDRPKVVRKFSLADYKKKKIG